MVVLSSHVSDVSIRPHVCNSTVKTQLMLQPDLRRNVEIVLGQLAGALTYMACGYMFLTSHTCVQHCAIAQRRL